MKLILAKEKLINPANKQDMFQGYTLHSANLKSCQGQIAIQGI